MLNSDRFFPCYVFVVNSSNISDTSCQKESQLNVNANKSSSNDQIFCPSNSVCNSLENVLQKKKV